MDSRNRKALGIAFLAAMVAMVCNAYGVHCVLRHSSQCLTLILLRNRCATVTCAHFFLSEI